jgi:hypothetical protein
MTVVVVVGACAAGGAGAQRTARLPAPLVGAWTRFVTKAEWTKVGIATEPGEHATMLVGADGSVILGEWTDVRFASLSGSRVRISGVNGCGKKQAVYRWKVAAGRLTFTKVQDACAYSLALFGDAWKREHV